MLTVDGSVLRDIAGKSEAVSDVIVACDYSSYYARISELLPGSATAYASSWRASELDRLEPGVAQRLESFSAAIRGAASNYEATDEDLATFLGFIGEPPR